MYRNTLREGAFAKAPMIADPVSLFDNAPDGDGAAAVVLVTADVAEDMVPHPIVIRGSAVATDRLMLQERTDILKLEAIAKSSERALSQAKLAISDIDMMELHDAYTILTALAFENLGLSEKGTGWEWANKNGENIQLSAKLPISTFGGLKSRGNPAGATGVYQAVEGTLQLQNLAGENQVENVHHILIQNLGGLASTAVTHILSNK